MKKLIGILGLVVVLSLPMLTNAATTRGGKYVYSTGYNRAGSLYGFIGNKSGATPGITYTNSYCIDGYGRTLDSDTGYWWSESSASSNPNIGRPCARNGATDTVVSSYSYFYYYN